MLGIIGKIFSSGVMGTVERIATEMIETDKEKAEAQTLLFKTLDPNGIMRRELSRFASIAYGYYLVVTSILVMVAAFGPAPQVVDGVTVATQAQMAAQLMSELFLPITGAWTAIVSASFGVNAMNVSRAK